MFAKLSLCAPTPDAVANPRLSYRAGGTPGTGSVALWMALVLALSACGLRSSPPVAASEIPEEDSVLVAVLDSLASRERADGLVVLASTAPDFAREEVIEVVLPSLAELPGISTGTATDFQARNASPRVLRELPRSRVPIALTSPEDLAARHGADGETFWQDFYVRYPGASGFLTLSRPGFDAGRTQAVVVVQRRCGTRCGTGWAFLLARHGNGWRIFAERVLWIT
jgi:hypothetical protein